jgi:hypothetical protein
MIGVANLGWEAIPMLSACDVYSECCYGDPCDSKDSLEAYASS